MSNADNNITPYDIQALSRLLEVASLHGVDTAGLEEQLVKVFEKTPAQGNAFMEPLGVMLLEAGNACMQEAALVLRIEQAMGHASKKEADLTTAPTKQLENKENNVFSSQILDGTSGRII
jgi:uncharacterized membrane protein YdfJ with MMPL/SSD domain